MVGRDIEERIGRCLIAMEQLRAELMTIWKAVEVPGGHTDAEMHKLRGRAFTGYVESSKLLREVVALAGDLGCKGISVTITLDGPVVETTKCTCGQYLHSNHNPACDLVGLVELGNCHIPGPAMKGPSLSEGMDRHRFRTHRSMESKCLVCGEVFNHKIHFSPEGKAL